MRYLITLTILLTLSACKQEQEVIRLSGKAQGTTFNITYYGEDARDLSAEVEEMLLDIDQSLSLWKDDSFISALNSREDSLVAIPDEDRHFLKVFNRSKEIFNESKGAFDPSIYPLIKAWGFGAISPDSDEVPNVDSLRKSRHIGGFQVGLLEVGAKNLLALPSGMQLDFNAIAQGYSVDVIAELIENEGVNDYLVEIGGELRAAGSRPDGTAWKIGIDRPLENEERSLIKEIQIRGESLATSGNYRKAVMRGGKRYSHTIDASTGFPVTHNLLSATVIAQDCASADAYATVCMVLGTQKALDFARKKNLEVYLIHDENGELKETGTGRFSE